MEPKPFFIIAHNPNTPEEVNDYLKSGVNAIEPDVHFADGSFYVSHNEVEEPSERLPLETYIDGIKGLLRAHGYPLAWIAFDMKPPYHYDPDQFLTIIRERLTSEFPDIAVSITTGSEDGMKFLKRAHDLRENEAVGVDEYTSPEEAMRLVESGLATTYANGISVGPSILFYFKIKKAMKFRGPKGFHMVYVWAVCNRLYMRAFLHLGVDAILTDLHCVTNLLKMLKKRYAGRYRIAKPGDNPFKSFRVREPERAL